VSRGPWAPNLSKIFLGPTRPLRYWPPPHDTTTEANPPFLGAKSTSIRDCVGWSVGWSVRWSLGPSVPTMQLRGKLVTSRLLREEEEEEENWLRRDSFAPRD
jgi:hypothetical protein